MEYRFMSLHRGTTWRTRDKRGHIVPVAVDTPDVQQPRTWISPGHLETTTHSLSRDRRPPRELSDHDDCTVVVELRPDAPTDRHKLVIIARSGQARRATTIDDLARGACVTPC